MTEYFKPRICFHYNSVGGNADLESPAWISHLNAHSQDYVAAMEYLQQLPLIAGKTGTIDTKEKIDLLTPFAEASIAVIRLVNSTNDELKHKDADPSNHYVRVETIKSIQNLLHPPVKLP